MKDNSRNDSQYLPIILKWLEQSAGLHFPPSKQASLVSRLYQFCIRQKLSGFAELAAMLNRPDKQALRIELINTATTNHTSFFREQKVLDYFKREVLPNLGQQPSVRIWSAASSSGEESYSLAMIIATTLGLDKLKRFSILGTDINQKAIQKAESAVYPLQIMTTCAERAEGKFFEKISDKECAVDDNIKNICTFRRLNLKSKPWPFNNKFHLVACRNVLYYFNRQDQTEVVERIYEQTEPGGILLTSVTESLRDLDTRWQAVDAGIYRKG